jgi:hypothetical protein
MYRFLAHFFNHPTLNKYQSTMSSESPHPMYPGVNLPLRHLQQEGEPGKDFYRVASFEGIRDATSELIQAREVAMMLLMDRLTDKPNWHEKVFDEEIVAKWREEALAMDEHGVYVEILGGRDQDSLPKPARTRYVTREAFDFVSRPQGWIFKAPRVRSPANIAGLARTVHRRVERQGRLLQENRACFYAQLGREHSHQV